MKSMTKDQNKSFTFEISNFSLKIFTFFIGLKLYNLKEFMIFTIIYFIKY